ncbi:MAG: sodium-dependent transporter [Candidatus Heteroscillospira sp.]
MEKQHWSGEAGFVAAAAGAAVGFGNLWSFPRHIAESGGAVFLIVYLLLAALVGCPLLMAELAVGRETGERPAEAFRAIGAAPLGGVLGQLASLLMMGFYSVLGGCCIRYMFRNLAGAFRGGSSASLSLFLGYISNVPLSAACTVLFIVLSALIVMGGVSKGLERFSRWAMPLLIFMLPGLIVCSLSLPGATDELARAFALPKELSAREAVEIAAAAMAQLFFSLSLGQGVMLIYGAYMPERISVPRCAIAVILADTAVAVLAAMAVVPAFRAAGGGEEGAMMLFVTMQSVFDAYGAWGSFFGFLFYLLVLLAAVSSAVSLLEVLTSFAGEGAGRKSAAVLSGALAAIPAVAIARDGMGFGALPEIMGMSWLDASELFAEALLMPVSALLMLRALRQSRGGALLRRQLGGRCGVLVWRSTWYLAPLLLAVMGARFLGL